MEVAALCETAADAVSFCQARWGQDALQQPGIAKQLHKMELWPRSLQRTREQVMRPSTETLKRTQRDTPLNAASLGTEVGLILNGFVLSSWIGAVLLSLNTSEPMVLPAGTREPSLREHMGSMAYLLGWGLAGNMIARGTLTPALSAITSASGKTAAASAVLQEFGDVMSRHEKLRINFDVFTSTSLAALCALPFAVLSGAGVGFTGYQLYQSAVFGAEANRTEALSIFTALAAAGLLAASIKTDFFNTIGQHARQQWDTCIRAPGAVFYAEGYHTYLDTITDKRTARGIL